MSEIEESAEELRSINYKEVMEAQEERLARERRLGLAEGWALEFMPRILPATWAEDTRFRHPSGGAFARQDGLKVIWTASLENDDKRWIHISCSFSNHIPSWEDLKVVKLLFIGADRYAYQVFPSRAKYVNLHPFVLHLFSCLDGEPMPDFTGGTSSL